MSYNNFGQQQVEYRYGRSFAETVSAVMKSVYLKMTFGVLLTAVTAFFTVMFLPNFAYVLASNSWVYWGLAIAEIGVVLYLSARINTMSQTTATLLFYLYALLNGVTLSLIFYVYSLGSIATTFFVTAGTFGAMALVGYTTKTDLTSMGKLLFMALLGIIIASVVNMFVASSGLDLILSYVGVLVFVGLTAYDTQKIKQMCQAAPDASESTQKLALIGALSLYLDFINLFLYLLRIFGNNRD